MVAKKAKTDSKPNEDFTSITQRGLKAQALAVQHQAQLGARIPVGFVAALTGDLASFGAVVPAVITARDGSIQFTAAQNSALEDGYGLVTAARTAVKGQQPAKDVLLAYGVGSKTSKHVVKEVKAALQKIVDRATALPKEAATFGIIASDVTAMAAHIKAIDKADQEQEAARANAPLTTKDRNSTARRILASIKLIAGAGMLAYPNNPTVRATFAALIQKGA